MIAELPHARPQPVHHGLRRGCGERIACPIHGMPFGPHYRPAERLACGTIVAHDCGQTWRPWQLPVTP
jgi:hypothetical protein